MSVKPIGDTSSGKKRGPVVLEIPLDQLLPDPHQPRVKFKQQPLGELAESIKSQGLQQLPTAHFAYHAGGRDYFTTFTRANGAGGRIRYLGNTP